MTEQDAWRARLLPPPGGLDRLAHALSQPAPAHRTWIKGTAIAMACSLCIAAGLAMHVHNAPRHAFEQALQAALAETEHEVREPTVPPPRELPSSRPDVRILLVQPVATTGD